MYLLLDVLQPRPDPLELRLVLVKVHRGGRGQRAERERLRGDAGVDDLQVGRDGLRPLVGEDSCDGRGPEGPCEKKGEVFEGGVRVRGREIGAKEGVEGRRKRKEVLRVSDSPRSAVAKERLCRSHRSLVSIQKLSLSLSSLPTALSLFCANQWRASASAPSCCAADILEGAGG